MRNFKKLLYFSIARLSLKFLAMAGVFIPIAIGISPQVCEGQSWEWGRLGKEIGMKQTATGVVATDAYGNAFLTGGYYPRIVFGTDTIIDSTIAANTQGYYVKYNSSGTVQWAKQFYSQGECYSTAIDVDASNNVIMTGLFGDDMTIGSYNLFSNDEDFFLAKCDNNGNSLWAISPDDSLNGFSSSNAVTIDKSKNIFITGNFFYGILKIGTSILTCTPDTSYNVFIAKYDSNGNALWGNQGISISPIANYYDQSYSVATDINGNSFITGSFIDTIVFGSDTLTSRILNNNDGGNLFLVKYSPSGAVVWARQSILITDNNNCNCFGYSVTTDNVGSIYVTGAYTDSVSFGAFTLTGQGVFFVKYNSNGDVVWAQSSSSSSNNYYSGYALSSDKYSNIYMAGGGASDNITFGSYVLVSPSSNGVNSFVIKFDSSGNALCGSMLYNGGSYSDDRISLAVDAAGKYVYQASVLFSDTIFCANDTLISVDNQSPYVARWQPCNNTETSTPPISNTPSFTLFPNPNTGQFTIQVVSGQWLVNSKMQVEIYNVLGEKVYSTCPPQTPKGALIAVNIVNQPNGIYLYRVMDESGALVGEGKFVVEK
jgi:hypothetical protein